jgi:hypothetical protein
MPLRGKNMIKKILYILFVFNFFSCGLFQTSDKSDVLLPRETEIPGWRLEGSINEFTTDNLPEYLKEPDKNLLNTYGFKELYSAKYKKISKENKEITVEIFTMDSPLNAFGILSIEKIQDSKDENICENSYSTSLALISRKENHYIKIKSGSEYPDSNSDLEIFLKIICDKIKNSNPLPRYLTLFEKKDMEKSLVYRVEGYPKFQILKQVFTRKTDIFGKNKTVFFGKRESGYISMGEFSNLLKDKEKRFILSSAGDSRTAFLKLNDNDFIYISVYKEWIFGIMDAESMVEGEKTINYLYNDLKEFIKDSR